MKQLTEEQLDTLTAWQRILYRHAQNGNATMAALLLDDPVLFDLLGDEDGTEEENH